MSQFRIKKVDLGLPDEWVPRTNDDGFQFGDDIVAEDPNDLAGAILDTQTLLLKASVYAPSVLINPNSGVLERIKLIEDTVGSSTLQSAYESGNLINPAPGVPLILGPGGTIEIDSSGNLSFNPSTMRVRSGDTQFLNFSVNSINTSTNSLTIQTSGASRDLSLIAGNNLSLRDRFLLAPVTLSETGNTTLQTTSKSLVGAINELKNSSSSAGLQQIYAQSFPARIETTVANGRVIIDNKTGNPLTPALETIGNFVSSGEVKANSLVVGAGSGSATVSSTGQLSTSGNIITSGELRAPTIRAASSALTLADFFGSASLTSIADPSLLTEKKTIFGAINELHATSVANSSSLAAYAQQHNSTTGFHEIVTTRAATGQNSTDRIIVQNDIGTNVTRINALGEVRASNFILPTFNLLTETQANNTHRSGSGLDHSAVSEHISHPNPHNTVKSISVGSADYTGAIILKAGLGVTLTAASSSGNTEISVSAEAGSTLAGVYLTQAKNDGPVELSLRPEKNLYFKNDANQNVVSFEQDQVIFNKNIVLTAVSSVNANDQLNVFSAADMNIQTGSGDLNLSPAGALKAKNISIIPGVTPSIPQYFKETILETILSETEGNYVEFKNNTGQTIKTGAPITIDSDRVGFTPPSAWTPISNAQIIADEKWLSSCFGIAISDVAPGQTGWAKSRGLVKANILQMTRPLEGGVFQINDTLYVADAGYATVEFKIRPDTGNNVVIDGVTFTAGIGTYANKIFAIGADIDATFDNFVKVVNSKESRITYSNKSFIAVPDGRNAIGDIVLTENLIANDTFTINASSALGTSVTFTAVAAGTKTSDLQFEISTTKNGTALNLFDSILATNKVTPSGTNGHLCVPTLIGDTIRLRAREKGTKGNLITLTASTTRIQRPASLSGGRLWAKVFFMSRMSTGKLVTTNNSTNIGVTNFTAEESEFFYISAPRMFSDQRKTDFDSKLIKVGKIVNIEGDYPNATATIMVEIEDIDVHKA